MNYTAVRTPLRRRHRRDREPRPSLLTMLYDRLVLDLQRAEAEQRAGDRGAAGPHLMHAQDIVHELAATLDVDAWDGARRLMSVYTFLHHRARRRRTSPATPTGPPPAASSSSRCATPGTRPPRRSPSTSTPLERAGPAPRAFGELGVG